MRGDSIARVALCAAAVVGTAGLAVAGPDVIVGDLYGSSNFGTVSGKAAFSIGTVSCNVGDAPLAWYANTTQHPVISQNLYRLSNGRFQQLGQAWLKHGFCALQGTVCSPCTPGGDCSALFPGCSDPYDASLNGQQSGLGPKSEVNAFTGAFPYPWINQGSGSGATFKRLQAATSMLGTAGAQYYTSSMYVQPQDATGGYGLNNQSYRTCNVTFNSAQSRWEIAHTGTTQRTKPALQAWRDADATVQIVNFDVPGEGRFIVAMKATSLGGGNWHYEYAVQNLNSDRSGQSFVIPIPAGTSVTNIGFSDVDYHSGEPYALTDWTSAVSSNQITWSTQTHAQNANANALRWDTIYNFWFDANAAPVQGSAAIVLFKPGSPTSIAGNIQVPGGAGGPAEPANNACANAANLTGYGTFAFDTTGATTDGPLDVLCANNNQVYNDVWYTYTACASGNHTLSTCGATLDSKIAVYSAACPTGDNTALACNDDSATCGTGSLQSSVTFAATAGATYRIRVGSYYNNTTQGQGYGQGNLVLSGPSCAPAGPDGDDCDAPIAISGYGSFAFNTGGATTDGPTETAACNFFGDPEMDNDIWFRWTACAAGTVTFGTCGSANYDSEIALYGATCPTAPGSVLACNDDASGCSGNTSRITYNVTSGATYLIRIGGYNGATGSGSLVISGPACPPPAPPNNDCAGRSGVGVGATPFTTVNATTDGPAHTGCLAFGNDQVTNDVWFNHPSQCPGSIRIDVCDATYDTKLAVYDDAGCTNLDARLMACNDDACGTSGLRSQVRIPSRIGRSYTIRIGGYNGATGTGNLSITYCPGDFDASGTVDVPDIFAFLSGWFAQDVRADIDGVPGVAVPDIFTFLSIWFAGSGPCN